MSECNSGNYTIVSTLDTISMIESEEDNQLKKCRMRCTVLESHEERMVNLEHFTHNDTTVTYRDKIALIIFDVDENDYHDTVVVDRIYMTKNFIFYSSHKQVRETDSLFFTSYCLLKIPEYEKRQDSGTLVFMFGSPFTKRIYGSNMYFHSAGYYSRGNNMVNDLYGE